MVSSVLAQDFSDFELILVDDGSTDGTQAICEELAREDVRIRYIRMPQNAGASVARNTGLDAARGKYVWFGDSDDRIAQGMFEKMIGCAREHNVDIITCNMCVLHGDKRSDLITRLPYETLLDREFISSTVIPAMIGVDEDTSRSIQGHWRSIYRRDLLRENEVRYPEDRRVWEDHIFIVSALRFAQSLYLVRDFFYHYVKRSGSLLSQYRPQQFDWALLIIQDYKAWLGNSYDLDGPARIRKNIAAAVGEISELIFTHERDADVDKKSELMKILTHPEVKRWYGIATGLSGTSAHVQKAMNAGKPERAYRILNVAFTPARIRRLVKNVLCKMKLYG